MPTTGDTALEHLPQDFHDLVRVQLCQKNERVNVMGVVVDWKEPSQTRNGTDLFATYNLQDPTSYDPKSTYEGLAVRLFWPDEKSFPKVKSAGDVLILRGVHVGLHIRMKPI